MPRLTIDDRRERALVAAADALLWPAGLRRVFRRRDPAPPQRILCCRLERIGDLLMAGPALAELRALAPDASIDLVVGSWNRDIARALPGVDRVETLDADWLAREGAGSGPLGLALQTARWRSRRYDLAINFEPDIRTNIAVAAAGARRSVGFASGGGGALLDVALEYDASAHTIGRARGAAPARVQPPFRAADPGRDRTPARPRSARPPALVGRPADLEAERPRGGAEAGREGDRRGRGAREEVMGADSITAAPTSRDGEGGEESAAPKRVTRPWR